MRRKIFILAFVFSLIGGVGFAQCELANNKHFKVGERLNYDLYFKYGLLNTKAGNASLETTKTNYQNQEAYKMTLLSHSTGMARKVFKLDDTLVSYMSWKLRPLAFWKDAHEGDEHTVERQTYSYLANGNIQIQARRVKNGQERHNVSITAQDCTYDMLSIVYYARTLDYSSMKKGSSTSVEFISGKDKVSMSIYYQGIENVKANNNRTYSCIKLSLKIRDKAFENQEDAMTVFITNDQNRVPIQINSKLKRGSTRAVLKSYSGLMN